MTITDGRRVTFGWSRTIRMSGRSFEENGYETSTQVNVPLGEEEAVEVSLTRQAKPNPKVGSRASSRGILRGLLQVPATTQSATLQATVRPLSKQNQQPENYITKGNAKITTVNLNGNIAWGLIDP
jgi:hypothetical protein